MNQRKVLLGSALMVGKRWAARLLGIAGTMTLARLLAPADYGLWALALSLSVLFEVLTYFHFDLALIRQERVERSDIDTAWTLNVISNSAMALLLAASAPLLALITRTPDVTPLILCVALCVFIDGFQNTGMVMWRRQLLFGREVTQELCAKVVEVSVAIGVASVHPTVWALALGMLAGRTAGLVMSFLLHPHRPRWSLASWRSLLSFSSWAMGYSFLDQLSRSADTFVLGRLLGVAQVGLYANGRDIAAMPTSELATPIGRSLFPAFSNLLDEPHRLREAYLKALSGVLLVTLPFAVGLVFVADAAVQVLLGDRWKDAIPVVQGMALAQVVVLSGASRVPLLMAHGRMKALVARACVVLAVRPLAIGAAAIGGGLQAVPWAVMAALTVGVAIDGWVISRALGFGPRTWMARTWRPYANVAVMAAALWFGLPAAPVETVAQALIRLGLAAAIAAPVYLVSAFALWHLSGRPDAIEATLFEMLRRRLPRRGSA